MSSKNIEIVRAIIPPSETDLAALFRDDARFGAIAEGLTHLAHPDLECVARWQEGRTHRGIDGLRKLFLDRLEPWAAYYSQLDGLIDVGEDRVLTLARDRGRRPDMDLEVGISSGSLWEIREGKLVRVEFFRDRDEAYAAAGLSEGNRVD